MSVAYGGVPRAPQSSSLADVLDIILDKGIVIDLYVRVSLVGIELLTIDARIVVASVDTYLRFAREVGRLQLGGGESEEKRGLPEAIGQMQKGGAESETEGAMQGIGESFRRWLPGDREGEAAGQRRGQGGQQEQDDERGSRERRGEPSSASPSPPQGEARPPGEEGRGQSGDGGEQPTATREGGPATARPRHGEEEARSPGEAEAGPASRPSGDAQGARGAAPQDRPAPDGQARAGVPGGEDRPEEPDRSARRDREGRRGGEEREDQEPELRVSGRLERRDAERPRHPGPAWPGDAPGTAGAPSGSGGGGGRGRGSRAVSPERRPPRGRIPVGR